MTVATINTYQEHVDNVVLDLLPRQGNWSEDAYLWLTDHGNRLIEYTNGYIEVLPMPTDEHQRVLKALLLAFMTFVEPRGGIVQFSPLRLRISEGKFREPDLLVLNDARDPRRQNRFWLGADLVVEVVSADNPQRDLVEKRQDYAEAGIPEYWTVDLRSKTLTVLRLAGGEYVEHGVFGVGTAATSALLEGFSVNVGDIFAHL